MSSRILLTEGSSLSSREAVTALGVAGHRVALLDPDPVCIARFSRFVARFHRSPSSGGDPEAYLRTLGEVVRVHGYEVILPTHEQAALLARHAGRIPSGARCALASAASFDRIETKVALSALLDELALPQPPTYVVRSRAELLAQGAFPVFAKTAFGTASAGVRRIAEARELEALASALEAAGALDEGVVLQAPARGALERVQAVFCQGRLVAIHAYRQIEEAISGGDVLKESVARARVREDVARIGATLAWHGALSLDYFWDGSPSYIDANPRLVEPMNATLSGANLADVLLRVTLGDPPSSVVEGRAGTRTRLSLMGVLTRAQQTGRRGAVVAELGDLLRGTGRYADTVEELTPLRLDPFSAIPLAIVATRMALAPKDAARVASHAVASYAVGARVASTA
jgi:predicted ATP-grasp superfamily ATP-dependent carboligase